MPPSPSNPYRAPKSTLAGPPQSPALQARLAMLRREAQLWAFGALLVGVAAPLLALITLLPTVATVASQWSPGDEIAGALVMLAAEVGGISACLLTGRHLLRLERPPGVLYLVVGGASLLAAPVGPVLVLLAWLAGRQGPGPAVLGPPGAALRAETPGLVPTRAARGGWFLLGAVLLLVVEPVVALVGLVLLA